MRYLIATSMIVVAMLSGVASGQTTRPVKAPATRPSPDQLHAQAVELMTAGQAGKARVLLDQAYRATPAAERSRALILNRATVEIALRGDPMWVLREVSAYLIKNRDPDEPATNVLGTLLNLTADKPRWKQSETWQNAFREWDRRNYHLDRARPGYHRWGAQWLEEQDYLDLRDAQKASEAGIKEQQERADRAAWRTGAKKLVVDQARYEAEVMARLIYGDEMYGPGQQQLGRQRAGRSGAAIDQPNSTDLSIRNRTVGGAQSEASRRLISVENEYRFAQSEERAEYAKLEELKRKAPRPVWPTKFEPVAVTQIAPPPIPPGDPKAVAKAADQQAPPLAWPGMDAATTQPAATTQRGAVAKPVPATQRTSTPSPWAAPNTR